MLHCLHKTLDQDLPVYGMNCGSVGFLMNQLNTDNLHEQIEQAQQVTVHPLRSEIETVADDNICIYAVNEISLFRETRQTAVLSIRIDGQQRLDALAADGVLVATSIGSTAYNLSAHGPILPLGCDLIALTAINAFRPRRWSGALIPVSSVIEIEVQQPDKRPVSAVADFTEIRDIRYVRTQTDFSRKLELLFDPNQSLDERILNEQFIA